MIKRASLIFSTLLCAAALTAPALFSPSARADAATKQETRKEKKAEKKAEKKKEEHRGKVTAATNTSITIQHHKNVAQTFSISDATKVTVDKKDAKIADIATGMHAKVTSEDGIAATAIHATSAKAKK